MNSQPQHSHLVKGLAKPGESIINDLNPQSAHLFHMAAALCGEAGELLDPIKKNAIYGKRLDIENIIEELGDIEFYLEGIRGPLGITREEVLQFNIAKLSKRYQSGAYTNQSAIDREDKK